MSGYTLEALLQMPACINNPECSSENSRVTYFQQKKKLLQRFPTSNHVEGEWHEFPSHLICTDKWARAHNMPFNVQLEQYALGLLEVTCQSRQIIFSGVVIGKYYDNKKGYVQFSGEYDSERTSWRAPRLTAPFKIANLSHYVLESARMQLELSFNDPDSDSDDDSICSMFDF